MKEINFKIKGELGSGVQKLADAVGSTLGAKGLNVIYQTGRTYSSTKDGVTVSQQVEFENPIENAAAQIVKQAAARTARDVGDGTTTATVIANAIIQNALDLPGRVNMMDVKRGIDLAVANVLLALEDDKSEIEGRKDILDIATISSNNDPKIGEMIADVFDIVGKNGAVRLEETQMNETMHKVVEGCQINTGFMSPNFINNGAKRTADYSSPLIYVTDKVFTESFDELVPLLNIAVEEQLPLVIICPAMEGETIATLVINKVQKKFPVVVIKAPEFGEDMIEALDDIATITGATMFSEDRGLKIADVTIDHLGRADRVVAEESITTIIGRSGSVESITERIDTIKGQLEDDMYKHKTWKLNKRIAMMDSGVGVIYVGGNSEAEMKDSYFRIEDALSATKAALDGGYVDGGGLAYLRASKEAYQYPFSPTNKDISSGIECLTSALKAPISTIITNCGIDPDTVIQKLKSSNYTLGYNALTGIITGMKGDGIIDPLKVAISAVVNAASVAGMLITTNCVINDKPNK